jgi:hypothetical protein
VVEDEPGASPAWQLSADGRWLAHSSLGDDADGNGLPDVYVTFAHEPRVVDVTPSVIGPGARTVRLGVQEAVGVPMVEVVGGGVRVAAVRSAGPGLLDVDVVVEADAAVGPRDLVVRNRGDWPGRGVVGARGDCGGCLTVTG